jgi:diguanylate cyclase (GGDEF)-like protein
MGHVPPTFPPGTGISLFVPAYFVCAGILIYAGITAAIVGWQRERSPLYLSFAATCLSGAGVTISIAAYFLSSTVEGAIEALRWQVSFAVLVGVAIVAFVGVYTHARNMRQAVGVCAAIAAVFLVAGLVLPLGIRYASVESHGWYRLPWGESLFYVRGAPSAWNVAFRIVILAIIAWTVRRLLLQYRSGAHRETFYLAAYLVLVYASSIHGVLIDWGYLPSAHSIGFALVGLALVMGYHLQMRLRDQQRELEVRSAQLRAENERRREAEAQLRTRAFTDALTGMPNRLSVLDHLSQQIEQGHPEHHGGVAYCDLDHFKVINNALSHQVGDELLVEVGKRVAAVAEGHAIAARMSGDTFLIVLEPLRPTESEAADRIDVVARDRARALSQPYLLGERSLSLTASFGVTTFTAGSAVASEVVSRAAMALDRAKKRGRNSVQTFMQSLQREAAERYRVVAGLRQAIEAGELELHFQPQVDRSGHVIGAEALMRWTSRTMGSVAPSTFIPIAEESGLIHALGEWSLRVGCEHLARWSRAGLFDGHLSINVSPWQLARPDFVAGLIAIVHESGVDPRRLTLEITESAVLFDVQETVAKLREIRPIGVRIALDDFGTGYSSLALIKDLPLDAIKIDQSFVRHLDEGANKHLIRVVLAIGTELGIDVIAEGVETAADRDALVALGCANLQGYHFARPMAEAAFLEWLRARRPGAALAQTLSA